MFLIKFIYFALPWIFFASFILRNRGLMLAENILFSAALGLGVLSNCILILGLLGFLYVELMYIVTATLWLVLLCLWLKNKELFYDLLKRVSFKRKFSLPLTVTALIVLLMILSWLTPVIGNDSLAYHLYHSKLFVQNHKIFHIPYTRESLWPYFTEMLFSLGLLVKSEAISKMFHGIFALLTALSVYTFSARYINKKAGVLAGILVLFTPGVFMQAAYCYVDLVFMFYSFMVFYLLFLYFNQESFLWLILAGIFCGFNLSVKYLGFFILLIAISALSYYFLFQKRRTGLFHMLRMIFVFLFFAGLTSFVWYLRSFLVTGNPLFPFYSNIFGNIGWCDNVGKLGNALGFDKGLAALFMLPWNITMFPVKFGGEQLGLIFLAYLPFLIIFFRRYPLVVRYTGLVALIYSIMWFYNHQNIRFLFPIIPLLCVCIGYVFYDIKDGRLGSVAAYASTFFMAMVLFFNISLCFYYNLSKVPFLLGKVSCEEYLLLNERSYKGWSFLNRFDKKRKKVLLVNETRAYYSDNEVLDFDIYQKIEGLFENKKRFLSFLKDNGIDYIFLRYTYLTNRDWFSGFKSIYKYSFTEKHNDYDYEIFMV